MNINLHVLDAGGSLKPYRKQIEVLAGSTVKRVSELLPLDDVDLVFYDNPRGVIHEINIGGYTPNARLVFISLDPSNRGFERNIGAHLGRQIAHELHHALRWRKPGYGKTLLEAMVSEGLADHFSYEAFPGTLEPWNRALSGETLEHVATLALAEYNNQKHNHAEWFFGTNALRIPRWSGYTLGYELVKEYLQKHPTEKASTLYDKDAEAFSQEVG